MTDEGSTELNIGIPRTIFDERKGTAYHFSPDVDSNCLSSKSNARHSVTSDLDRAVAALEARSSNLLEHSFTSVNVTTCSPSERELKQDISAQKSTVPTEDVHNEETTKPRDFSELKAMFSQTDTNQNHNMLSTRKGKLFDLNSPKTRLLDTVSIEHEELDSGTSQSEGGSMVARMKRNFEATRKTGIENTWRIQKKPVSFEVSLEDDVTGESSRTDTSYDPSHSQPIMKETESAFRASKDSPSSFENLQQSNEQMKEKEMLTEAGTSSDSSTGISFDISVDDIPPKRVSPKTMPNPAKDKLTDRKIAEVSSMDSSKPIQLVDEGEQTLDSQEQLTDFSTNEKYNVTSSCSLEVCLEDAVPQPSERETANVDKGKQTAESQEERKDLSTDENSINNRSYSFEVSFQEDSPKKVKSRERLNKLLVRKPCRRADGPPGEEMTVSGDVCENEQNGLVQEETKYSTDNELQAVSSKELPSETAPKTTKEHFEMGNGQMNEKDEMKKTTQGISFDICFNDDSVEKPKLNRKPKLTPKHIRLKMTKEQQNDEKEITTKETISHVATSSSHCLKEPNERNTYTLDEVSSSLQCACQKGLTLEDALDDLAKQQETRKQTGKTNMTLGSAEVNSSKRGTYSLDEVATCLVSAADKGLTVAEALDNLANSEEKGKQLTLSQEPNEQDQTSITSTYEMNNVSQKIDDEEDKGSSLEEALIQLLDEVETVVKETQTTTNRGTYDLNDVSKVVEQASDFGIPVEKTLEKISTLDDDGKTADKTEVTATLYEKETVSKDKTSIEEGRQLKFLSETFAGKRGTYSLDEVEKQLEKAADEGSSVVDTLSDISKLKLPETIISSKINGADSCKLEDPFRPARNTYTLDEVAQSLELAKSKGIPIVEALSNISTERRPIEPTNPGSRETYTLDEVAQSLETAREKGLPIVMALENLVINSGGSLRGPAEVAVHRRQGKLTNRKTYALASPLETIGEEKQLRLFDGTSRKLLPPTKDYLKSPPQPHLYDDPENTQPSGQNVVQTLDLLTSACEALLETTGKRKKSDEEEEEQRTSKALGPSEESRELRQQFKAESRDSGISFPGGPSERGTYSLDEVSATLEGATEKGIPVIDALGSLTAKEPVKIFRIPRALRKAGSKSESSLVDRRTTTKQDSSRQTYSLDNVSDSVEDAKAKGIPVIAALDELTNSLAKFSATRPTPGKPLKKPDRPSIARKKEAARQERANVRSELGRETQKPTGSSFPLSYPPAMRNSYSLDDVASAFEKAYQTGIPFQDVLEGMHSVPGDATHQGGDAATTRSTGSLQSEKDYPQSTTGYSDYSRKTHSASSLTKANEFSMPTESDSSLDGKTSSPPRKSSTSSEGSLTCSSSYGSDVSVNRDSSSTEELSHGSKMNAVRKQRKRSNGPFQLKKGGRRNSPANLRQQNMSPSSLQGDSIESLASHDSEQSDSASQTKRGTYDLKKIGDELDKFKVQGVPVVQGLDNLVTDVSIVSKAKNGESTDIGAIPKRGTYSLDDVSQQLDNKKEKGDAVIHVLGTISSKPMDSQLASDNNSRNTFTLDHVDVSITDAEKRGIPVVEALDKLSSHQERHGDCTQNHKPAAKASDNTRFIIEYFPSKKEEEAPKFRVEKGAPVQVREEQIWEHRDLDNYPTRDGEMVCYENSTVDGTVETQLKEEQIRGDPASQIKISTEQTPTENEVQVAVRRQTRPRWQRSGSYVEALESYEERLTSNQDLASSEPGDSIPVKESDYHNGNYDTMHPERASNKTSNTSPRGRSTWRPSGSVLDEILNLMDQHEEQGLSIADALEKAAELSEQQGGSEGTRDRNTHRRRAEQTTLEQESQMHGYQANLSYRVLKAHHDNVPLQKDPSNNRPRHCWEVEKPTVPPSVVDTARFDERHVTQADVTTNENEDDSSKKGLTMFIADEPVEGLTPEQQKKRDRFLRNRQKKMEEEKARRELENEKKRQREIKQQELEAQKRVRHTRQPEQHSRFADYTSPPRIIKSSGKSNRKMISNALSHACLSGAVNNENRERCLQAMSDSQGSHFIILLKDGLRFRGLFVYSPENEQAYKIHGTGPKIISSNMVDCVYKYNSGSKEFIKIPSKTLSISVDGVAINKVYWQTNKPNVASKTQSNLKRPPRPPQR